MKYTIKQLVEFAKNEEFEFMFATEEQLDKITESKLQWKDILKDFLNILNKTLKEVEDKSITEVINKVNEYSPEILKEKKVS